MEGRHDIRVRRVGILRELSFLQGCMDDGAIRERDRQETGRRQGEEDMKISEGSLQAIGGEAIVYIESRVKIVKGACSVGM